MPTGVEPTSFAWLPHSLYIGCANGQVITLDTATALKSRHQAQHAQHAGQPGAGPVETALILATAGPVELPVVAMLEFGGQKIQVEALAVNKDCVAVAGHCPVVR